MKTKKMAAALLAFMLAFVPLLAAAPQPVAAAGSLAISDYDYARFQGQNITLNVYNWGLYISDGTDGENPDVNAEFERLTGIKVNYTTFDTNENLYAKLATGGASYDVIFPSDYMIGKMVQEDMLAPLNFDNIPNYAMIGDAYKNMDYDPQNAYSVPYTWGYVGIIYNTTMVEGTVDSWGVMWDPQYKGQVLMFDNSRDAFGIASLYNGLPINPRSTGDIDIAAASLVEQRDVVQAYVMDQIFDKMEGGEAAIAPYYAGDAITMIESNPDLAFAVPKEGTNYFVDAMCIPKNTKNQEAAEAYINFMCESSVSAVNSQVIGYSTPQLEAQALLPEELRNNPIAYPDAATLANMQTFSVLPDELNNYMDRAWSDMRSASKNGGGWIIPVVLVVLVGIAVGFALYKRTKKKRADY